MKIKDIKRRTNEENLALCEVLNIKIPELITLKDQEITKKTYKKYAKIYAYIDLCYTTFSKLNCFTLPD